MLSCLQNWILDDKRYKRQNCKLINFSIVVLLRTYIKRNFLLMIDYFNNFLYIPESDPGSQNLDKRKIGKVKF